VSVLLIAVVGTLLLVGAFGLGMTAAVHAELGKVMREAGLNKNTAKLYGRAVKILNRLAQITDLDGAYAGDVLSDETKKQVTDWVTDYRAQLNASTK
jgi:hypothetical protein